MSKDTGGQAFPVPAEQYNDRSGITYPQEGMTFRDYAAVSAMQGLLANRELQLAVIHDKGTWAGFAYEIADEMIAERNKQ